MAQMTTLLLTLLAFGATGSTNPAEQVLEQDGVRIRTTVESNLYTWTVENVSAEPITEFSIPVHHAYDFQVPSNWQIHDSAAADDFSAVAVDGQGAIGRGRTAQFSARFTSHGAILGCGPATLGVHDGTTIIVASVWHPVAERARTVYLTPITICAIAGLHVVGGAIIVRRRRRDV
ncbi:MAG: hypothetical protein H6816_04985 [Phycisphaerales bacterium]|nr:hypothetical protein [Phycisphaerales bacterium]